MSVWDTLREQCERLAADAPPAPSPREIAGQLLRSWGVPPAYADDCDESNPLEDHPSEQTLQAWIADWPRHLQGRSTLLLCGVAGIGKTFAMARALLALARVTPGTACELVFSGQHWGDGRPAFLECEVRRPWLASEVRWYGADELGEVLGEWQQRGARDGMPIAAAMAAGARVLCVDDLDRWFTLDRYDRARAALLYRWDALAELRNRDGAVTVVTLNRTLAQLREVPEFGRWLSRAQVGGCVLEIPGRDRRAGQLWLPATSDESSDESIDPFQEMG